MEFGVLWGARLQAIRAGWAVDGRRKGEGWRLGRGVLPIDLWRRPGVDKVRLWECLGLGRLERLWERHRFWCRGWTWEMPVRRSSTRPTLALTLAISKAKHKDTPKRVGSGRGGNELSAKVAVSCTCRSVLACGFEGCAREPVPWSFRCQPCGAACPSAYPKPHSNMTLGRFAVAAGREANDAPGVYCRLSTLAETRCQPVQ